MNGILETLPLYLAFIGVSIGLLVLGIVIYMFVTPYREITLIRNGNRAAAFSFGGTVIGLAYAIHGLSASTWSVRDLAVWGVVGVISQIAVFFVVGKVLGNLKTEIEADNVAYGAFLGFASIAIGIMNSGALSS